MPLTLNDGATTITLPDAMQWVDEYDYDNVKQDVQYMIGGGIAVSENLVTAGRPITLESGDNVWVSKDILDSLVTMRSVADLSITLTLPDDRTFTVNFDRSENISASPILRKNVQLGTDYYTLRLKLMEI